MINRETGKTYRQSPMGGTPKPTVSDLVQRTAQKIPSQGQQALEKLMTAYNNRAYANPYAPLLYGGNSTYTTGDGTYHDDTLIQAGLRNGDRLGFVGRDINTNNGLEYRAGLDLGDINRNYYDSEPLKTPIGNFSYGHEGDTDYVSYDPNLKAEYYIQALANLLNR